MELIFAAKTLSSMSFLFFVLSYAALLFDEEPMFFPAFAVLSLVLYIAFLLDRTGKRALKYLPFVALPAAFLWTDTILGASIVAFCALYAILTICKQAYAIDYGEGVDIFKRNIKIIAFLLFVSIVFGIVGRLGTSVLPFIIIYLVSGVAELSMLRHSDETLEEKRFKIVNSSILVTACLVGLFMSTDLFMTFSMFILRCVKDYIIAPFLMLMTVITSAIVYALTLFFTEVVFANVEGHPGKIVISEMTNGLVDDNKFTGWNSTFEMVLQIVGMVGILLVLFLLMKRTLSKSKSRRESTEGEVRTKEYIGRKKPEEKLSNEVKGIRNTYRKFLKLLNDRGLNIPFFFTTADIHNNIKDETSDLASAAKLRQLYLEARYGEKEMTKAQVQEAKDLYSAIKKNK